MSERIDVQAEVDRWARELRKGSARLAVLTLVARGETYGYEILASLRRENVVSQGATEATVYPVLHNLESRGFLASRWRTSAPGVPSRKYYQITTEGERLLEGLRSEWKSFRAEMDGVVRHG